MAVSVRITLPEDTFQEYDVQSRQFPALTVEELLTERLIRYKNSHSDKPLILEDADRRQLEQMFQINLSASDRLVSEMRRALSIRIDSLEITLPSRLLERLKSRAIRVSFDTFLRDLIIRSLEEHVGLR